MRLDCWLQAALALLSCLAVATSVDGLRHQRRYGLLQQLLANATRSYGSASSSSRTALLANAEAIASTPFFQELSSQQRGQVLLQAAQLHLNGDFSTAPSIPAAQQLLQASADEYGNPDAQFLLGALLQGGNGNEDEAQSVLYYHFGARGGSVAASMALGYRHLHGYGAPKSCESALRHYKFAADRVISTQSSGYGAIQVFSSPTPFRLADDNSNAARSKPASLEDDAHRLEYLRNRAIGSSDPALLEKAASVVLFSDLSHAASSAASLFAIDSDAESEQAERNLEARALLERAANLGSFSAKALLAHVYAYGLGGSRQDVPKAIELYEQALNESAITNQTSAEAANGLGLVYFNGMGDTRVDYERAMRLFGVSARKGHADGVYNTAVLLSKSHPRQAQEYLEASAHVGHLKAQFKLARMKEKERFAAAKSKASSNTRSAGSSSSCEEIVGLYKQVAENAHEGTELLDSAAKAAYFGSDWPRALQLYLVAADMGYEVAENNAAWLLERTQSTHPDSTTNEALYRRLVRRGVAQDSPDAHVRYGDLLYREHNFALAMHQYELADFLSRGKHGRALFNMAYMHETGLGVSSRSLQIASLYYELVASVEPAMKEIVWLLQLKLKIQSLAEWLVEELASVLDHIYELLGLQSHQQHHYQSHHGEVSELESSSEAVSVDHFSPVGLPQFASQIHSPARSQVEKSEDGVTFASALRFSGDSRLQLEARQTSDLQSFTIETWLKIQQSDRTRMVLLDTQDAYQLELARSHDDMWQIRFRTSSELFVFGSAEIDAGGWNHIALVVAAHNGNDGARDAESTISLFVNGELQQQFESHNRFQHHNSSGSISGSSPKLLSVGGSLTRSTDSSAQFIGSLMHFRIWKAAKSPASLRLLMLTPQHDVHVDDLLVQLQFEIQREASFAKDSSAGLDFTTLERTTSALTSNALVYVDVHVDPEIVRFPPEQPATKSE